MKNIYVYRNVAIEYLLKSDNINFEFSSYGDISNPTNEYDAYLFFYIMPYKFDREKLISEINNYYERLKYIIDSNKENNIYIVTLYKYNEFNNIYTDNSLQMAIDEFNEKIYKFGENVRVIDIEKFFRNINYDEIMDMKYYYSYNLIINPKLKDEFAEFINKEIEKYWAHRKKCLIVDLDNTLWGGIVGEDGISNIKISGDYPGNCYADFQSLILELKKNGIILCIVSKNNKEDVDAVFTNREDMILKKDDFVIIEASWKPKDEVINSISNRLNISLSDIVFIDDNIAERELIRYSLPEVITLDFPEMPYLLTKYFSNEFERLFGIEEITSDDENKTKQYKAKIVADDYKNNFTSVDEFIKNLKMKITFEEIDDNNKTRIVELINKSNQFNLTTKRYTIAEIENIKNSSLIYAVRVKDKFDDLGIVGVAIVKLDSEIAEIDTFLLSCRVIGRKVENEFLDYIIERLKEKEYKNIKAKYIKTQKNSLVKDFYLNYGFDIINQTENEIEYEKMI